MGREILDNVLSGPKAGFKAILNFEHAIERKKMDHQKSKSTFSATLPALILGLIVLWSSSAIAAEMVKDPATGKMVGLPQYGGKITTFMVDDTETTDYYEAIQARALSGFFLEKMVIGDFKVDRDMFDFTSKYMPFEVMVTHLATGWETPDSTTIIIHIRQGVHWQNKPPVNGRELTAKDVEYTFERLTGLGEFEEVGQSDRAATIDNIPIESVTATDEYTVEFKLSRPSSIALTTILYEEEVALIVPREPIDMYGSMNDWRYAIGTGPFIIIDHVDGSSWSFAKNPDYWAYDPRYPENRLPYVDEAEVLIMPDMGTRLAALSSGKLDT